jgi:hypothetical protein
MENKPELETNVVKPAISIFENETEYRLIDIQTEISLDSKINEIENFMNTNHGAGKSELEKDNLYLQAKNLWEQYAVLLRDMDFTFYLNRKQYQFLTDLLIDKMEYDVNTIFLAIELTNMLGQWKESGTAKDDTTLQGYPSDATEVTYMYHLISKHKVKGLSNSSYRFSEVLKRIGSISKVIAYYDTHAKNLSKDIQDWVATFDGIQMEGKNWGKSNPVVEGTVEETVKKTTKKKKETSTEA